MNNRLIFFLFCIPLLIGSSPSVFAKDYLDRRIDRTDKRAASFTLCFELLERRNAKILVETGTARNGATNCFGDGCSTLLFADWARDHSASLFSVDIDPHAISQSMAAVRSINPHVQFATQDSISFLKNFNDKIDFLYLDSYDFDFNNPNPSQRHHLYEIEAAYPHLHENTVIMIDDCGLPYGGKGKLAIEFLTTRGWQILYSGYQTILIYPAS